jgi:protein-tyrosine phosphatase
MSIGFIDIHSHLLPGVDDGCDTVEESLACARALANAGYSHVFCTPHIWDNLPFNTIDNIRAGVAKLQAAVDAAGIPVRLVPGGEISSGRDLTRTSPDQVVTAALRGKYALIDFWADAVPAHFEPNVRWLQSLGLTVILAHPERMRAVQRQPELAERFARLGVLLQGNLQCISDEPGEPTRDTIDRFLREGRYFAIGSDTHGVPGLPSRLEGLARLKTIVDEKTLHTLLITNPAKLLP